jgi:hypothetical protein
LLQAALVHEYPRPRVSGPECRLREEGTQNGTLHGEIPILEDGDLRLRDAQAILVYLAKKYDRSQQWFPDDAEAMGKIAQWLSTGGGEIMNAAGARLVNILNYPLDLERLQAGAHRAFKIMDDHLASREWLELGHTRPWPVKVASISPRIPTCCAGSNA